MRAIFCVLFFVAACQAPAGAESTVAGYENNQRITGAYGLSTSDSYKVTGRYGMTGQANQCQAKYNHGNDTAEVTYGGRTEYLPIVGVNNRSFFGSSWLGSHSSQDLNAKITDTCGTVIDAAFVKGSKKVVKRFVVVDRIYQADAQDKPNLDIQEAAYNDVRSKLGVNDNFYGVKINLVAFGSFFYDTNPGCKFDHYQKTGCANGW